VPLPHACPPDGVAGKRARVTAKGRETAPGSGRIARCRATRGTRDVMGGVPGGSGIGRSAHASLAHPRVCFVAASAILANAFVRSLRARALAHRRRYVGLGGPRDGRHPSDRSQERFVVPEPASAAQRHRCRTNSSVGGGAGGRSPRGARVTCLLVCGADRVSKICEPRAAIEPARNGAKSSPGSSAWLMAMGSGAS